MDEMDDCRFVHYLYLCTCNPQSRKMSVKCTNNRDK